MAFPHIMLRLCGSLKPPGTIVKNFYPIAFLLVSIYRTLQQISTHHGALCLPVHVQGRQTHVSVSLNRDTIRALAPTRS